MNKIETEIREASKTYPFFTVLVREFKFDNIRQESYWVTKDVKKYAKRSDAEKFVKRFS